MTVGMPRGEFVNHFQARAVKTPRWERWLIIACVLIACVGFAYAAFAGDREHVRDGAPDGAGSPGWGGQNSGESFFDALFRRRSGINSMTPYVNGGPSDVDGYGPGATSPCGCMNSVGRKSGPV